MENRSKPVRDQLQNDPNSFGFYHDKNEHVEMFEQKRTFWNSLSYGVRSALAIFICLVMPAVWFFDLRPVSTIRHISQSLSGFFGDAIHPPLPNVVAPPAPYTINMDVIDYMSGLKDVGLGEQFSMPAIRAFYENHIPIDFLQDLQKAGLLQKISFPAVIAFYQNGIPLSYLSRLADADLLDALSFPAVVSFYQNKVTIDYLNELRQAGLSDAFAFPGIVAFYQNQVPVSFIRQLKTQNLLSSLSFPDIINLYQTNPNNL
ncbi:MAG TPA: hypothetical protein VJ964_17095 [Balneolaceae bacterium]|nr:hypothetical protein [Balneolaceae bacterium]